MEARMMQDYFFKYLPKQLAFPQRTKPIDSYSQIIKLINRWNGVKNIYYSVYDCDRYGNFNNAHIDKVVFDFDDGEESLELLRKSVPKLLKLDYKFTIFFSGNKGFHLYVFVKPSEVSKNIKDVLYNIQYHIIQKLNIPEDKVDRHLLGDVARVIRVPNTLHLKSRLYAIPLSVQDLYLSYKDIRDLARKPRLKIFVYGKTLIDSTEFDYTSRRREVLMPDYSYDFKIEVDDEILQKVFDKLHPCVKLWLIKPKEYCKNETRWYYALYMTHRGIPDEITMSLAEKFWSKVKESNGIRTKFQEFKQEKQLYYAKIKNQVVPNCETLYERGWCLGKCPYFQRHNFPIYKSSGM